MCLISNDSILNSTEILYLNNPCKCIFCTNTFLIGRKCYYLVFSLQSDLIWSSVFYMALIGILKVHVWRLKEKLSDILPEGIMWRSCSGWNSHSGNYEMWEQYAALYLELWEKFLFYFYMIYQKLIQEPLENLFTSLWNGTIKKTLINISEAICVSEEYSQAQTNLLLNLDIWPSGCQAINDHL